MSSNRDFDIILIGAGPAALAALDAVPKDRRIAVVTGATPSAERLSSLHPKIQAVSLAGSQVAGVAERIEAGDGRTRPLFSTAAVGGLAKYWGQQFVRWQEADAWPRDTFSDFADYNRACERIERLFAVEGGEALDCSFATRGYTTHRPRLLAGSADKRQAGLEAMNVAFGAVVAQARACLWSGRVHSISQAGERWTVTLDDGGYLTASRVLLAAGVIGDSQILLRSFPDASAARFHDHTPWMFYAIGSRQHLAAAYPRKRVFNVLTAQHATSTGCDIFASFYDMGGADLNLLLASTIGRAHHRLRNWPSLPGAGLVTPVQVWTPKTIGRVDITVGTTGLTFCGQQIDDGSADASVDSFKTHMSEQGYRILRGTRTDPAFGFHYHGLSLCTRGGYWSGVVDFLQERTGGAVAIIDGAAMQHISCQPHTLTMMARTSVQVERTLLS